MNSHPPLGLDLVQHFWQAPIKTLARSGLSRSEYCRRYDLSYHAFTYWLRKHRSAETQSPLALVEVRISALSLAPRSTVPLRLHLGSSCMAELEPDFDETTLRRVFAVLGCTDD